MSLSIPGAVHAQAPVTAAGPAEGVTAADLAPAPGARTAAGAAVAAAAPDALTVAGGPAAPDAVAAARLQLAQAPESPAPVDAGDVPAPADADTAGSADVEALANPDAADGWNFEEFDEPEPTLLELARDQAWDIGLFLAFAALAMVSFLRKSVPLKYVTLVISVLYMGVYKSQLISVVNIFSTLTGNLPIFSYNLAWYAFAIFTVATTVLWGRLYCGRICAFGALTQLIDAVVPARFRYEMPKALEERASYIKYGILFGAVGYYLVTREIAFYRYIEPFWMFTFEATTVLWVGLGALLVASIFVRNLYCRFLCPLGAALGLLSNLSLFKIKRWSECSQCALCEKKCEWGAIRKRQIVMSECVRCDDCEILYDDKTRCPHWLLKLKRKARVAGTGAAGSDKPRAGALKASS